MKIVRVLDKFKNIIHGETIKTAAVNNLRPLNPLLPIPEPEHLRSKEEIYEWIKYGIGCFREWYQPVDFGNGVVAHVTVPPYWDAMPDLMNDNDRGLSKWNYIVKKHIPDVVGKRILDLGCSNGLFSIELARMGAREIIGIDRNVEIHHRSTDTPPPQDVIAQAMFVKKAFELLDEVEYPITYIAHDIGNLQNLELGQFDLILALCVVYHELDKMPVLVRKLAGMTDHLILQSSQGHTGELGKCADKMRNAEVLLESGFTYVDINAPSGYQLPVIVGRKGELCSLK
jgi:SAM-dependent methyltransferase